MHGARDLFGRKIATVLDGARHFSDGWREHHNVRRGDSALRLPVPRFDRHDRAPTALRGSPAGSGVGPCQGREDYKPTTVVRTLMQGVSAQLTLQQNL